MHVSHVHNVQAFNADDEIENANKYPMIRLFTADLKNAMTPQAELLGVLQHWSVASSSKEGRREGEGEEGRGGREGGNGREWEDRREGRRGGRGRERREWEDRMEGRRGGRGRERREWEDRMEGRREREGGKKEGEREG